MTIIEAVENNDIYFIKSNLGNFDPNQLGKYDFPLLRRACYLGHIEIIEILLDSGANIEIENKYGETPLFSIMDDCQNNWFDVIELLIDKGAKVTDEMLAEAVREEKNPELIELLINKGADVNAYDNVDGENIINIAYNRGLHNIIEILKNMVLNMMVQRQSWIYSFWNGNNCHCKKQGLFFGIL